MAHPVPEVPGPGQESVWSYPRPPRLEGSSRRVRVVFADRVIAESTRALRLLETSHPPTWYLPPEDVDFARVVPASGSSFCEWKGAARYWDVVVGDRRVVQAAWSYPKPMAPFQALADHLAFYASRMDACFVDDERVIPQPGGFYGGWITSDVAGPFKGIPGSRGW
jgi:uncharacterized protein (DUF427 family)